MVGHLILNASRLWREASIGQKQRLQKVFFPEGMTYLHKEFGTAATCLFFNHLQVLRSQKPTVVAPELPSWNQIREFLQSVEALRQTFATA